MYCKYRLTNCIFPGEGREVCPKPKSKTETYIDNDFYEPRQKKKKKEIKQIIYLLVRCD